tara:strand:+ start:24385 stop:25587 length:1203 start_codon:yes stop_codon:yes gene_type:complete
MINKDDFSIVTVTYNNSYFLETLFRSVEITEGEIIPNPIIIFDVSTKESDKVKIERVVKKKQIMGWNIKLVNGKKLIFLDDKYQYVDKNEYLDSESLESNVEKNFGYVLSLSETEYSMYIHSDIAFLMKNWRHYIVSKINKEEIDVFGCSEEHDGAIINCGKKSILSEINNYLLLTPIYIFASTDDLIMGSMECCLPFNKEDYISTDIVTEGDIIAVGDDLEKNYSWNMVSKEHKNKFRKQWLHPRIGSNWFNGMFQQKNGALSNYLYYIGRKIFTNYVNVAFCVNFCDVLEKKFKCKIDAEYFHRIHHDRSSIWYTDVSTNPNSIFGWEFVYHGPFRYSVEIEEMDILLQKSNPEIEGSIFEHVERVELELLNGYFDFLSSGGEISFEEWGILYNRENL